MSESILQLYHRNRIVGKLNKNFLEGNESVKVVRRFLQTRVKKTNMFFLILNFICPVSLSFL
jgi:hypothetical protein